MYVENWYILSNQTQEDLKLYVLYIVYLDEGLKINHLRNMYTLPITLLVTLFAFINTHKRININISYPSEPECEGVFDLIFLHGKSTETHD